MVITEDFFMLFFEIVCPWIFLHGFTVSSYQQPLLTGSGQKRINDCYQISPMSDQTLDGIFLYSSQNLSVDLF